MTFGGGFGGVFRPVFDQGLAAAASPWWISGGIAAANCVAAYQPKGAASLAASYVNLANPGTYNAAPGVAPTWASGTGWTFDGTQWLVAGIPYLGNQSWSALVRFTVAVANSNNPVVATGGLNTNLLIGSRWGAGVHIIGQANKFVLPASELTNAVAGIAGTKAYLNGASDGTIASGTAINSTEIRFAYFFAGAALGKCTVQAASFYDTILSAAQVAAISAAMAAL